MTTSILAIIAGIVASISGYFAYKNSPLKNRREAEKDVANDSAEFSRRKQAIKNAVFSHDETRLNDLLKDLVSPVMIAVLIFSICASNISCKSDTVYVTGDTYVEPCTNSNGVSCWAVPDPLMSDILIKLQKLQNIERENAVNSRLK